MKPIEELKPEEGKYYVLKYKNVVPSILKYTSKKFFENNNGVTFAHSEILKGFTHFELWQPKEENKEAWVGTSPTECEIIGLTKRVSELENNKSPFPTMDRLKDRIEKLEKKQQFLTNVSKAGIKASAVGEELADHINEILKNKKEQLSVEGILKEDFTGKKFSERPIDFNITTPPKNLKKLKALSKLLIIADYVNEGLEFKDKPWFPFLTNGNCEMDYYANTKEVISSPIKVHQDKKDFFLSIKGIEQLIKDYLNG